MQEYCFQKFTKHHKSFDNLSTSEKTCSNICVNRYIFCSENILPI